MKARTVERELMDEPVESLGELAANLRDIDRANHLFGGITPIVREIERTGAATILDVACGSATIPRMLVDRVKRTITITCLDASEQMLAIAMQAHADCKALTFARGDARELPYADRAFDAAMFSLTLHHLAPADAVHALRELRRVSRMTPIVCDLRRSRLGYVATWAYTRIATRNRLTRHDGPLSVRRAYTPYEALELARGAGWNAPRVRVEPWFRMTLVDA